MKKYSVIFISALLSIVGLYYLYTILSKPESPFKKYAHLIPGSYRLGFTNLDTEIANNSLVVTGTIPPWLNGTLYRNGPGKFTTDTSWVSNWFDGLAMIHAFTIDNGTVTYTNTFLRGDDYHFMATTGLMTYAGFVQDPCRSIFKTIAAWFTPKTDAPQLPNANVNIANYDGHLVALTETPLPIEFDATTLETIGGFVYADQLPKKDIHETAHPHYDPITEEHLGYFTKFGPTSTLNLYGIKDGSTQRRIIGSYETEHASYMHSFAITQQYAIFAAIPFVINLFDLIIGSAFIRAFRWKPELGTRFIVFNRHTGARVGIFKGEPFFAFHTINAFEQDSLIHLDMVIYNDASAIITESTFDHVLAPTAEVTPTSGIATRFTLDPATKSVSSHTIVKHALELPRINYDYNGKEYTYMYAFAQSTGDTHPYVADTLLKVNVTNGETIRWSAPHCFPGEGVFIARPDAQQEDDGVVVSVVLDAANNRSFLLILDAQTFTEIARAAVPHHIPFGIHGQYYSNMLQPQFVP